MIKTTFYTEALAACQCREDWWPQLSTCRSSPSSSLLSAYSGNHCWSHFDTAVHMNPEGVLLTPTPVWRWLGFEDLALKSEEYDWPHSTVSSVFFCMVGKEKTLWKSYISGSQPQCILLFCSCVTKFGWVASASSMSLCRDTGVTEMRFAVLVFKLCEIYVWKKTNKN